MRYKHKMGLLRKDMDDKRAAEIKNIEKKKNDAIKDLTQKH